MRLHFKQDCDSSFKACSPESWTDVIALMSRDLEQALVLVKFEIFSDEGF
jgi:hypothetical protein